MVKKKLERIIESVSSAVHRVRNRWKSPSDRVFADYVKSDEYKRKQEMFAEKATNLFKYEHDQEIAKRVFPKVVDRQNYYSLVDPAFSTVTITDEALQKGNYLSKRLVELTDRSLELYLYPLDKKETPIGEHVIRDLYIAKDQQVTEVACDVDGTIESALDIRGIGMRKLGWVHSHGNLNTFFSSKDHDNMRTSLDTSTLLRKIRIHNPSYGGQYQGVEYEVRFADALVLNARGDAPFVAIAVEFTDLQGNKKYAVNQKGFLKILDEQNMIDMDSTSLDAQLRSRVHYYSRPPHYMNTPRVNSRRYERVAL